MPSPTPEDLFTLRGRRALVTGAGRGIGRAIALGLAAAGAQVALVARSSAELEEVAAEVEGVAGRVHGSAGPPAVVHPADLADTGSLPGLVRAVTDGLGGVVDVVVHSAGVQARGAATELTDADFERVLAVNLTAPWRLSTEVARTQLAAGSTGSHVMVASMLAVTSRPAVSPYVASKTGLLGAVRALSTEWAPHGIRVNALAPGYVATALTTPLFEQPEWREQTLGRVPLGRFGTPEDLVGPALFLASGASSYVTGQLITVDGGWTSA